MCHKLGARVRARDMFVEIYTKGSKCSLFWIIIKSFSHFLPVVSSLHHFHKQRTGTILVVSKLFIQHLLNSENTNIER